MKDLQAKVAVITGGGSGIGRGMALAFADAGMKVVVADVEADAAHAVAGEVGGIAVQTDVSDAADVQGLADRVFAELGAVHVLCNNAGVGVVGTLDQMTLHDWQWVLGVNLHGVAHGLLAFLPRMRDQDGEAHIVNTASMAGILPSPLQGVYSASKFAVVALSEVLRMEMAERGIGVTVVCPGLVRTNIFTSRRNRPSGLADTREPRVTDDDLDTFLTDAIDPEALGLRVRRAVEDDELYVFAHNEPYFREVHDARAKGMSDAFERPAARGTA